MSCYSLQLHSLYIFVSKVYVRTCLSVCLCMCFIHYFSVCYVYMVSTTFVCSTVCSIGFSPCLSVCYMYILVQYVYMRGRFIAVSHCNGQAGLG